DRRRGVRVAGRPARSAPPLMTPPLLDGFDFAALTDALAVLGADGWLVYDFRKVNPVAERILGPTGMGTRRLFVLLPRAGRPIAVAHRIELQPLAGFPGEVRPYGSWRELHGHLGTLVRGTGVQARVREAIERAGLWTNEGPIVAFGPTSAMPHYEPHAGADRRLAPGDVVLLDLWAGPGRGSVFADQTWMGFAGRAPDAEVLRVWQTVKAARDAAVRYLREHWRPDGVVTGAQVDDAARG